jgi:ATP-binding cassette, subfamily F, member 3
MIYVQDLVFRYGSAPVFDKVSFSVAENQKVGLVGVNGAGKSTLLKLLLGREEPDAGKLEITGQIGYVPQEVKVDPDLETSITVHEYLDPTRQHSEFTLRKILTGLEMEFLLLDASPQKLSGGQKTKLALARSLLAQPDILLLDEPTNFMDVAGKKWVMNFLSRYPKTLIIISHDLDLMDKQINKVIYIRPQNRQIEEYTGNYSQFVKLKKQKDELLTRQVRNQQQKIDKLEESVAKLRQLTSDKGVRQRVVLQRKLERLKESLPELPQEVRKIKIDFPRPKWVGELPIKVTNIHKSYGEKVVLNGVRLSVRRGERVALIGPNGAGKSTLLKIMMGLVSPDVGEILRDEKLDVGYYSQEFETFDMKQTLVDVVRHVVHIPEYSTIPILAKFLFTGDKIYQRIESLSGGEKTRLAILLLMLQHHNLLILDEPTTYLDVVSQRIILDALKQSKASMIIVSHTEEFIKELKPSKYLLLPENISDVWSDEVLERVAEV